MKSKYNAVFTCTRWGIWSRTEPRITSPNRENFKKGLTINNIWYIVNVEVINERW